MRSIVQEICLNSYETRLDLWDVLLTFRKRGDLYKIGADRRASSILTRKDGTHETMMANYFSVGECAKIGFDFEEKRTGSKCCNVIMYACAGIKHLCCSCCCWTNQEKVPIKQQVKYASATSSQVSEEEGLLEMNEKIEPNKQARSSFRLQFN